MRATFQHLSTAQTIEEIDVLMTDDGFEQLDTESIRWYLGSRGLDSYHETHEDELT